MLAPLKDRCLFWLHPLPLSKPTQSSGVRARVGHITVGEKRRTGALLAVNPLHRFHGQSNDHSARATRQLIFPLSRSATHNVNQLFVSALQSFCMIRHCNFPINSVLFVFDPVCWRGRFASFNLSTVSKKRRLNIFWIREKMHLATDESAAYAFGRFVTIRIQHPASLTPSKQFMNGCLQTN